MRDYVLSVREANVPDLPAGLSTTGTIAVGEEVTVDIAWQGDRDWYAVELEANTTYRVDLRGFDGGGGRFDGAHLFGIYDSGGTLVPDTGDADSGVGKDARVEFEPKTAGTYYISAGSWNTGGDSDVWGSYTLSVTEGGGPARRHLDARADPGRHGGQGRDRLGGTL